MFYNNCGHSRRDHRRCRFIDGKLPRGFGIPEPRDDSGLLEDEEAMEEGAAEEEAGS